MLVLNRIIALVYVTTRCVHAQTQQRLTLVNLAKSLSENLQTTLVKTSQQIQELTWENGNLTQAVENLQQNSLNSSTLLEEWTTKISNLENRTLVLEDRREIDETIWNYNTVVCNASLDSIRTELEDKISKLNTAQSQVAPPESKPVEDTGPVTKPTGALDLLGTLDGFLENYDYYDTAPVSPPDQTKVPDIGRLENGSVTTLVEQTNKLLLDINTNYKELSKQVSGIQKETEGMKKKMESTRFQEEVDTKIKDLQDNTNFNIDRLRGDLEDGDSSVRNEIKLKVEDIELLKKISSSRLSIYETRLEELERTVINLTISNTLNMEQIINNGLKPQSTTTETTVPTTEKPEPDYFMSDELDNFAAMFGSDPQPSDVPPPPGTNHRSTKPSRTGSTSPPPPPLFRALLEGRDSSFSGSPEGGDYFQSPDSGERSRRRSGRKLKEEEYDYGDGLDRNSCECARIQERLAILESGFENLMTEVESQMSGIQVSMTRMIHRLQDIEAKNSISGAPYAPVCVASQETAGLDGMDSWCRENCENGNCPSNLCSCPK